MKIKKLKLRNFAGLKSFDFEPNGQDAIVYGCNGTGKTTVYNSFLWLLFGVDSAGRADYKIKPQGVDGKVQHNLTTSVECFFTDVAFKREYRESYTKKRGSVNKVFTGHITNYFIDDVPVQKKEYDQQINEIADKKTFKLLTNPLYFQSLKKEDRRSLLLSLCDDVSDVEVIASNKSLKRLPDVIGKHSVDDFKKVIKARKKLINDKIKELPARIDEVERGLIDVSELDKGELVCDIEEIKSRLKEKREKVYTAKINELRKALAELDAKILNIKHKHEEKTGNALVGKRKAQGDMQTTIAKLRADEASGARMVSANYNEMKQLKAKISEKKQEWEVANAPECNEIANIDEVCPACKRALPKSEVQAARKQCLTNFTAHKSAELERIMDESEKLKVQYRSVVAEQKRLASRLDKDRKKLEHSQRNYKKLEKEIAAFINNAIPVDEQPEYKKAAAKRRELEAAIAAEQQRKSGAIEDIASLTTRLSYLEAGLTELNHREDGEKRIRELETEEKKLAVDYERLEADSALIDDFVRAKVSLLTDRINALFEVARFKLFDIQINEGIKEICELTYRWQPPSYSQAINAGLDIIRTFAKYYNIYPPVFIDNAESINELVDMPGQIIKLIVNEDKKLRIETAKIKE